MEDPEAAEGFEEPAITPEQEVGTERYSRYQVARERQLREASNLPRHFSETLIVAGILCIIASLVASWGTVSQIFEGRAAPLADLTIAGSLVCFAAGISLVAMGGRDTRKKD